jgi:hypothetical protein
MKNSDRWDGMEYEIYDHSHSFHVAIKSVSTGKGLLSICAKKQ